MASDDRERWIVLANFAFHSACNGFMWMDYSTVSLIAEKDLHTDDAGINSLYSMSFMTAIPAILAAMLLLDGYNWSATLMGTTMTVATSWLRWAAIWQGSFNLALASSAGLGLGIGIVFAGFADVPALWFAPGRERALASAIAVQSNFFGWAMGGIIVPSFVASTNRMLTLCFVQAVVVSLCWPAFFLLHRVPKEQGTHELLEMGDSSASRPASLDSPRPASLDVSRSQEPLTASLPHSVSSGLPAKSASLASVMMDPESRQTALSHLFSVKFMVQGFGCALLQAVGFTIPGVQEQVFDEEGYTSRTLAWTGFAFIISGVVMGMLLGRFAPSSDNVSASYRLVLVLYWAAALALGVMQLVCSYGHPLGFVGKYLAFLLLMSISGACCLGYLNLALPLVCNSAHPVPESVSGGFVELLGQLLASQLTSFSTGRQFWVCGSATLLAAIVMSLVPAQAVPTEDVRGL